MPRFASCRLIIDAEPLPGDWNMAVDAALLTSASEGAPPTVRWYRWLRPTVSLGYFQSAATATTAWPAELDVVRRPTGGGAIVHHHEWTYSCTLPQLAPLLRHPYELYDLIHQALCAAFEQLCGVTVHIRGAAHADAPGPFLCFLREDARDVCCRGRKFIGSAQRRRRGSLLQHGSILLKASPWAPELPGLVDLVPEVEPRLAVAGEEIPRWLAGTLGDLVTFGELTPAEQKLAAQLVQEQRGAGGRVVDRSPLEIVSQANSTEARSAPR
uniref:Lipoate--protein ligase family protein n=1 Tax=Schlesneria paludicola TaxID=360056 RepID=A0A7C4LSD6_9PLAN